jgi:hypothetical protein
MNIEIVGKSMIIDNLLSIDDILDNKDMFLQSSEIYLFAIILSDDFKCNTNNKNKIQDFYKFLYSLNSIKLISSSNYNLENLELIFMFDLILSESNLLFHQNIDTSTFIYDFKKRYSFLYGHKIYEKYLDFLKNKNQEFFSFSHSVILNNGEKNLKEKTIDYVNKIINNKSIEHLNALFSCLNLLFEHPINKEKVLTEESIQFCNLISSVKPKEMES